MIPAGVIQVRADICGDCPTPCEFRPATDNPCARCPINRWGTWGTCNADNSAVVADTPAPAGVTAASPMRGQTSYRPSDGFTRRIRGYAAAGMLAATAVRHARRDVCAACPWSAKTKHAGLYLCKHPAAGCGCVGGNEVRLALAKTKCPLGKWAQ